MQVKKVIKIIAYCGPSGSRLYRIEQIAKYLNKTGEYQFLISPNFPNDEELVWADLIFLQHTIEPRALADAWAYKVERGKKIITDIDDTIEYKESSPFYDRNKKHNAKPWMMELLKISDLVTCTTQPLYEEAIQFNKNVHVLPNYLDMDLWDKGTVPNETPSLRLLWAGSITHRDDLEMIAPVIRKLLLKYEKLKFVSCGDEYVDKLFSDLSPTKHEYIQAMPVYTRWGEYAQTLMADIAIAPLIDSHFNECKSFLKYLEYGMIKAPAVYSPSAYKGVIKDWENGFIANNLDEWEKCLTFLIEKPTLRDHVRKTAYLDVTKNYDISKHVYKWNRLYKKLYNSSI